MDRSSARRGFGASSLVVPSALLAAGAMVVAVGGAPERPAILAEGLGNDGGLLREYPSASPSSRAAAPRRAASGATALPAFVLGASAEAALPAGAQLPVALAAMPDDYGLGFADGGAPRADAVSPAPLPALAGTPLGFAAVFSTAAGFLVRRRRR